MRTINWIRQRIWAVIAVGCITVTGISLLLWRWQPTELSWLFEWFIRILVSTIAITSDLIAIYIWWRWRSREPTEMPAPLRYFMTLEKYLTGPEHRFPKASDFEEGSVYLPESYAAEVRRLLGEAGRCLLVGRSGAGKTVLAIALARHLQEAEGYEIYYGDVRRAQQGDGRVWYQMVRANDHERVLYILDDCHLAPEEASEFCFQWAGTPPEHAQAILISRPRIREEEWEVEGDGYFDRCADVTVAVKSEQIYQGVLEKCAAAYRQQDPERYVPLEDDWAQNASLLEAQHSHNLVASKSRLEAWRNLGGRLSAVTKEAVYKTLGKYLTDVEEALPALCALWQYEIPAHNIFVETRLPRDEVKRLEDRHLLTHSITPGYGVLYQLAFHPEGAREVFEASIYRKWWDVNTERVKAETIRALRDYLKAKPPNYEQVYSGLYHQEETQVQHRLLADRDLQACAAGQFAMGRLSDTALYLYSLSMFDLARARELLREFLKATGIDKVRSRLLRCSLWDIQFALYYLKKVDGGLAKNILIGIKPQGFAEKVPESRFLTVSNLIRLCQDLGYPEQWLLELVQMSDVEELARRCAPVDSLQTLFWLVRGVKNISPEQARRLLEAIPVQVLADRATESDFGSVHNIVRYLQELDYPTTQLEELVELINMEKLAKAAEARSFQSLMWLVRTVKDISPEQAKRLLEAIPVQVLADRAAQSDLGSVGIFVHYLQDLNYPPIRSKALVQSIDMKDLAREATVNAINLFLVSTKDLGHRVMEQLSAKDVLTIFDRSPLGQVGNAVLYQYYHFEEGYALFQEEKLAGKSATEPLDEIGKFIARVHQRRGVGGRLAREALDLLVNADLSERIASTDLEQFAVLLYNANAVDSKYPPQLLVPLGQPEILRAAIENSGIRGIELLIYNVAHMDERYLQDIQQTLRTVDLTEKLAIADVGDLDYFLWNVFAYVDKDLSREYCRITDRQRRSERLREAPLDALCRFSWNLTHISDLPKLQTMDDLALKERLISAWESEIGLGAELLGIIATTQPDICEEIQLQPINVQIQGENLADWLTQAIEGGNPYPLSLTLRGLRVYDEQQAQAVARRCLPMVNVHQLLEDAMASVVTPRSVMLLEETLQWLEGLSKGSDTK